MEINNFANFPEFSVLLNLSLYNRFIMNDLATFIHFSFEKEVKKIS